MQGQTGRLSKSPAPTGTHSLALILPSSYSAGKMRASKQLVCIPHPKSVGEKHGQLLSSTQSVVIIFSFILSFFPVHLNSFQ